MDVENASLLWEEFGVSISRTKPATSVSSAPFWGVILQKVYTEEHILVPSGVKTVMFLIVAAPRVFEDDPTIFPNVSSIPESMPKLVDPKHQIFVQYFSSIDSLIKLGFFYPRLLKKG